MRFCRERKNYILCFLMVCLALCGICFEEVSTKSFLGTERSWAGEGVLSDSDVFLEQELWNQEDALLQRSDLRVLRVSKRDSVRVHFRVFMCMALAAIAVQIILFACGITERKHSVNGFSHRFIIGYIHQTDGEKEY